MADLDREKTPHLPVWELLRLKEDSRLAGSVSQVDLHALSHPGKVRTSNEDHYLALRIGRTLEALASNLPAEDLPKHLDQQGFVLLVADGIGGRSAGEHASRRAISALLELATRIPEWILKLDEEHTVELMQRAAYYFRQVNAVLEAEAAADPTLSGMGTTMTAVYLIDRDLLLAHVGDSRAYRYRAGSLERLTHDQTMAQALADAGVIAPGDVATHQQRHILTGALGASGGAPVVQLGRHALADGDHILVASDGLTEMVPDEEIAAILAGNAEPRASTEALVEAALAAGGLDNVTVIVARCRMPPPRGRE